MIVVFFILSLIAADGYTQCLFLCISQALFILKYVTRIVITTLKFLFSRIIYLGSTSRSITKVEYYHACDLFLNIFEMCTGCIKSNGHCFRGQNLQKYGATRIIFVLAPVSSHSHTSKPRFRLCLFKGEKERRRARVGGNGSH